MSYLALYRKYRPKNFNELVDQDVVKEVLRNQILTDKIGHAYLFCGSRGTGKTTTAKIFARSINCENPVHGSPCGNCKVCKSINNNLDIIEIDAASNNGVDEIRDLKEQIKYLPVVGKYKVYIIDEVHMLSPSAFNALLKTLEEPPKHVVFILATTEPHKLPATILSRCMRFDFKLLSDSGIANLIKSILDDLKIEYDENAVNLLAKSGEGSARDALSLTDMAISFSENKLTFENVVKVVGITDRDKIFEIADYILQKNIGKSLKALDDIFATGKNPLIFSKDLTLYFRDLLLILSLGKDARPMLAVPDELYKKMQTQATNDNYQTIVNSINNLSCVEQELRYSVHPKLVFETSLVKTICTIDLDAKVTALEKELKSLLENKENIVYNKLTEQKLETNKTNKPIGYSVSDACLVQDVDNELVNFSDKALEISKEELFGKLLANLKSNGEMILYSMIASVPSIMLNDNMIILQSSNEQLILLLQENMSKVCQFMPNGYSAKIEKIIDKNEFKINEYQKFFGSKFKIIE